MTRIAEKFGVFDWNKTKLKVEDGWPTTINAEYLICMHIVKHDPLHELNPVHHERQWSLNQHFEKQVTELKQGQ